MSFIYNKSDFYFSTSYLWCWYCCHTHIYPLEPHCRLPTQIETDTISSQFQKVKCAAQSQLMSHTVDMAAPLKLPVTSDSFPAQGLPLLGCGGLLSRERYSCPFVFVCLRTKPKQGQLSPAADAQRHEKDVRLNQNITSNLETSLVAVKLQGVETV